MVTDHEMRMEALRLFEMRMEALRLFEENERLRAALEQILAGTGECHSGCRGIAAMSLTLSLQKSAQAVCCSLPSGESDPSVTLDSAGADTHPADGQDEFLGWRPDVDVRTGRIIRPAEHRKMLKDNKAKQGIS